VESFSSSGRLSLASCCRSHNRHYRPSIGTSKSFGSLLGVLLDLIRHASARRKARQDGSRRHRGPLGGQSMAQNLSQIQNVQLGCTGESCYTVKGTIIDEKGWSAFAASAPVHDCIREAGKPPVSMRFPTPTCIIAINYMWLMGWNRRCHFE
jgi:hypothetical protein